MHRTSDFFDFFFSTQLKYLFAG